MKISIACSLFVLANITLSATSFFGAFSNGSQPGVVEEHTSLSSLANGSGGNLIAYGGSGRNYDNGIAFNPDTQTWFGAFSGGQNNKGGVREFASLADLAAGINVLSSVTYIDSGITYTNGISYNSDTQTWFAAFYNGNSIGRIIEVPSLTDLAAFQNILQSVNYATNSLNYSNGITYDSDSGLWYAATGPVGTNLGKIETFQNLSSLAAATNVQSTETYGSIGRDFDNFITVAPQQPVDPFFTVAFFGAFNGGSGVGGLRQFADASALALSNITNNVPYANSDIDYANGIAYNANAGTWIGSTFDSSNQRVIHEFSTFANLAANQNPIAIYNQVSRYNNGFFFNANTNTWFGADDNDNGIGVIREFESLSDLASRSNEISQLSYSNANTSFSNGISYDAKSNVWYGAFSNGSQTGAIRSYNSLADLAGSTNQTSSTSYISTGLNYSNFFTVRTLRTATPEPEVSDFSFDPTSRESRISFAVPLTGNYQVEYSSTLQIPWTPIPNSNFEGGLGIFTFVDNAGVSARRFYRAGEASPSSN